MEGPALNIPSFIPIRLLRLSPCKQGGQRVDGPMANGPHPNPADPLASTLQVDHPMTGFLYQCLRLCTYLSPCLHLPFQKSKYSETPNPGFWSGLSPLPPSSMLIAPPLAFSPSFSKVVCACRLEIYRDFGWVGDVESSVTHQTGQIRDVMVQQWSKWANEQQPYRDSPACSILYCKVG